MLEGGANWSSALSVALPSWIVGSELRYHHMICSIETW
jgi:hypothetical protein